MKAMCFGRKVDCFSKIVQLPINDLQVENLTPYLPGPNLLCWFWANKAFLAP